MTDENAAPASENGLHEGDSYPDQSTEPLKLDEHGIPIDYNGTPFVL